MSDNAVVPTDVHAQLRREREQRAELERTVHRLTQTVQQLATHARDISHDLKTPLVAICGYAQLLEHLDLSQGRPAEYDEYVGEITRSTDRMRRLIDDILEFATVREVTVRLEPIDLNAVVDDLAADSRDLVRPAPVITREDLPAVVGDHELVRRLMENLLGNATKYVRPGHRAVAHVTAEATDDGMILLAVSDRGVGIPDGQHERIFEDLHRAHPDAYPGSGLGLSICRRIVQRLGGEIGADPRYSGGARIWFRLPAAQPLRRPIRFPDRNLRIA